MKSKINENKTNSIEIKLDSIPEHVRTELAAATLEAVTNFIRQPGGRKYLDERIEEKKRKF